MKFEKGFIFSETSYYKVLGVEGNDIRVQIDGTENTPKISKAYAEKLLKSGDDFDKIEKKNKTELAEIFIANPNKAMTVCFNKQLKPEDIMSKLETLYPNTGGKLLAKDVWMKELKKVSKDLTKGEERVARGYHNGILTDEGRMRFIDMDKVQDTTKPYNTREIQVDTRSILYIIVNNVKFELK